MSGWLLPDEFFHAEVRTGHHHQEIVAEALRACGLMVSVTPLAIAYDHSQISTFEDEHDLAVGYPPLRVEVKSHRAVYHGPHDFPYEWALVDTRHGWERKSRKPVAEVLISQRTQGMCVIPCSTRPEWRVHRRHDSRRDMDADFYEVRRERLRTFEELVAWLSARQAVPGDSQLALFR